MKFYQFIVLIFISMFHCSVNAVELDAAIGWADIRQIGVPISGQIKNVMPAGSYVKPGEIMLSIKCGVYNAELKQHQAIAKGLTPAVETALKDKELADELFDRTVLSEVEHRNAELLYIKAKSEYDSSLARIKQAKIKADYCELKADQSQIILKTHIGADEMYTLESSKPVLLTVASRNSMLAVSKQMLPLNKVYRSGQSVKVNVDGKEYDGKIQSVSFQTDNSVLINAVIGVFDSRLIGNKTAKIIIQ